MYTVLLVDDEQIVIDSLVSNISWQQLGVNHILTASNGQQALAIMKDTPVDLLISDIKMPLMDGLALLQQVRAQYPAVRCIILTAYGEFEYAKTAIQLGVENYLLKPFNQTELEETVEKALDNLYTSHENTQHLFMDNLLLRWASGTIGSAELGERAAILSINVYLKNYCALCLQKRTPGYSLSAWTRAFAERLSPGTELHSFWDDKEHYVVILGASDLNTEALAALAADITQSLNYQNSVFVALGPVVNGSKLLAQSYQSACRYLQTADFSLYASPILLHDNTSSRTDDLLIQELDTEFRNKNAAEQKERFQAIAKRLIESEANSDDAFSLLAHCVFQLFQQEFPNRPGIQKQIYSRIHLFSSAQNAENFVDAAADLLEYSLLVFSYYFKALSPVIQNVIDCIHVHYKDGLSIKEFCAKYKMSTVYFGYLFKKETGMFFNNYLAQYRICSAIQLLLETEMPIHEIAEAVGFSSGSYFNTCFKKQTGLSPVTYRTTKSKF